MVAASADHLTVSQAARVIGVSEGSIRALVGDGPGPGPAEA
jgi:hypothetical protein